MKIRWKYLADSQLLNTHRKKLHVQYVEKLKRVCFHGQAPDSTMGTQEPQERRFSLEWRERTEDGGAQSTTKDRKKNTKVMDSKYQVDQEIRLDVITINSDFVR